MIIYTIQNDLGDKAWIQKINTETEIVIDEVMGGSHRWDWDHAECYLKITVEEYNIIKHLHDLINESGLDEYLQMIFQMTEITIAQNMTNVITKRDFA